MAAQSDLRSRDIQAISDWLIEAALGNVDMPELVETLCDRISALIPLYRVSVGMSVLHPLYGSQTVRWRRGRPLEVENFGPDATAEPQWQNSPLRAAIDRPNDLLRWRLDGDDTQLDFPIFEELRAEGATDYAALATRFHAVNRPGHPTGVIATWTSDRPGGFRDEDLAAIARLQPRLAVAAKVAVSRQIGLDLATTYLGHRTGRRVLSGEIDRGHLSAVDAVLYLCDLRNFTDAADNIPLGELIELLDIYFDAIVEPMGRHGGEVLKFMGDGLLAIFGTESVKPSTAVAAGVAAAEEALAAIDAINRERRRSKKVALDLDIALHLGTVNYGNVGARERLDFTVIGPAVNEASRMEGLCDDLGVHLLISESVAKAADTDLRQRLRSLGEHKLRGIPEPREMFTVAFQDGA